MTKEFWITVSEFSDMFGYKRDYIREKKELFGNRWPREKVTKDSNGRVKKIEYLSSDCEALAEDDEIIKMLEESSRKDRKIEKPKERYLDFDNPDILLGKSFTSRKV